MQDPTPAAGGLRIGTSGWAIPRAVAAAFPDAASGLERYAARFDAAEINTTFYRSHRGTTYARWAAATPADFRFAVKLPRTITHDARLTDIDHLLASFCAEIALLQDRLGPLLVQLPPRLAFDATVADAFFTRLRERWTGPVVCEPRHAAWFDTQAEALLSAYRISRVAADPPPHPAAAAPGGWEGVAYWRLHGSPRMYFSAYDDAALQNLASRLEGSRRQETWCVFDNTASGAAAANALTLKAMIERRAPRSRDERPASQPFDTLRNAPVSADFCRPGAAAIPPNAAVS